MAVLELVRPEADKGFHTGFVGFIKGVWTCRLLEKILHSIVMVTVIVDFFFNHLFHLLLAIKIPEHTPAKHRFRISNENGAPL